MTFVNELIPENEKLKFEFNVNTRPDGSKPTLWKWVIDRDRDVYLVVTRILGGGYEGTAEEHDYILSWKDVLVKFKAEQQLSGCKEEGIVMTWKIHDLKIPQSLEGSKEEVMQLIREALDAQGWLYDRSRLTVVNVEFKSIFSKR